MIKVIDNTDVNMTAEDTAMLQALYSRSGESVNKHLEKVKETGSGKFMEKFYIGYGHKSIGDCGTTTIFFEDISLLAAKVIQDNRLYSGQESSSRYIDFSNQRIEMPIESDLGHTIISNWMNIYSTYLPKIVTGLKALYPKDQFAVKEQVWNNTVNAKAFDIMRGLLPAGVTTQLSWHSNLRQILDNIPRLANHPLKEVRNIAKQLYDALHEKYPNSFKANGFAAMADVFEEKGCYNFFVSNSTSYSDLEYTEGTYSLTTPVVKHDNDVKYGKLKHYSDLLVKRPKHAILPNILDRCGSITFKYLLDFGSFRDIQRHRNAVQQLPLLKLLDSSHTINQWYMSNIISILDYGNDEVVSEGFQEKVSANLELLYQLSKTESKYKCQYYFPLATNTVNEITMTVPEIVYISELRSQQTVHPTLRYVAVNMAKILASEVKEVKLYVDYSESHNLNIKRGTQTIVEK
jgi:thymidylate synthase ThyX